VAGAGVGSGVSKVLEQVVDGGECRRWSRSGIEVGSGPGRLRCRRSGTGASKVVAVVEEEAVAVDGEEIVINGEMVEKWKRRRG
jgi:hypothetical protein